ncbi:MAG: hypothetical protein V7775_11795 [Sulfitobacter sp.]
MPIELVAMIVLITQHGSAYSAEVVCGGLNQVPRGLTEAGQVLGASRRVIWRRIKVLMALDPCEHRNCRHYDLVLLSSRTECQEAGMPLDSRVCHPLSVDEGQTVGVRQVKTDGWGGLSLRSFLFSAVVLLGMPRGLGLALMCRPEMPAVRVFRGGFKKSQWGSLKREKRWDWGVGPSCSG